MEKRELLPLGRASSDFPLSVLSSYLIKRTFQESLTRMYSLGITRQPRRIGFIFFFWLRDLKGHFIGSPAAGARSSGSRFTMDTLTSAN